MTFRVNFEVKGISDSFEAKGETVGEIKQAVDLEMDKRNLDEKLNNCWSEEI